MQCPYCHAEDHSVENTRRRGPLTQRRVICFKCGRFYRSYEYARKTPMPTQAAMALYEPQRASDAAGTRAIEATKLALPKAPK